MWLAVAVLIWVALSPVFGVVIGRHFARREAQPWDSH